MRMMHMGIDAYEVGETVTANLEKDDLLIIGSGSVETKTHSNFHIRSFQGVACVLLESQYIPSQRFKLKKRSREPPPTSLRVCGFASIYVKHLPGYETGVIGGQVDIGWRQFEWMGDTLHWVEGSVYGNRI
jgi:hypothetical protein